MDSTFVDADPDTIYLDGNSLGRLPRATLALMNERILQQWGGELIEAWEHWFELPIQVGNLLARHLLGAAPDSVLLSDSTSVNFYKLASGALDARPGRKVVVTDKANFPTDRYILEGLAEARGLEIRWIESDTVYGPSAAEVAAAARDDTALVTLSHVAYRSAAIADMQEINDVARSVGALNLWDLSHSVGALEIDLEGTLTDLAVGCTYKYLNGGPGSPAFLYVAPKLQAVLRQPIWGWFGQAAQFEMDNPYEPKAGIGRFAAGSPPIIALAATQAGIESLTTKGIRALRSKSVQLTEMLIKLADEHLAPHGFEVASPRDPSQRGGHVLLTHPEAHRISIAMRRFAKVVGDYRTPNGIRLAPVPAYVEESQVADAIARIRTVVELGQHHQVDPAIQKIT